MTTWSPDDDVPLNVQVSKLMAQYIVPMLERFQRQQEAADARAREVVADGGEPAAFWTPRPPVVVDVFPMNGVLYARRSDDALFRLDRPNNDSGAALTWCELPPVPGTQRNDIARQAEGLPRAE